jgi:hypothetical protein
MGGREDGLKTRADGAPCPSGVAALGGAWI